MERTNFEGLAFIRTVHNITPIVDADNIETAHVLGWTVVMKKGSVNIGDKVVYFEIDSMLPLDNPSFAFLEPRGCKEIEGKKYHRLKTVKLRKQISQGLIVSAKELDMENLDIDTDVTAKLNIIKYDREVSGGGGGSKLGKIKPYGDFPTHFGFNKTDETRIQNAQFYIEAWKGRKVVATVKMDGTSSTYFLAPNLKYNENKWFGLYNKFMKFIGREVKKEDFGVCSRNLRLNGVKDHRTPEFGNVYMQMAITKEIEKKLFYHYKTTGHFMCIQGEICGHGIQGNPMKHAEGDNHLYVFNVFDITDQKYLTHEDSVKFAESIGLEYVPIAYEGEFKWNTLEELLEFAEGKYSSGVLREGVVFRLADVPMKDDFGKHSFKVVANSYLMKFEN